jgi:hypothetical protein
VGEAADRAIVASEIAQQAYVPIGDPVQHGARGMRMKRADFHERAHQNRNVSDEIVLFWAAFFGGDFGVSWRVFCEEVALRLTSLPSRAAG